MTKTNAARWWTITLMLLTALLFSGMPALTKAKVRLDNEEPPYAMKEMLTEPRLFAERIISTSDYERAGTFTPDGRTFYFTKRSPGGYFSAICVSHFVNGHWTKPEIAPFSGQYPDQDAIISPDGTRLLFASRRPVDGKPRQDTDIWMVRKTPVGWSEPENLRTPVNSVANEGYATVTNDGTLYFYSSREGGKGAWDIYRSRFVNGKYAEPENVDAPINTATSEYQPYIAPDESYLIFVSEDRPDEIVGDGNRYPRGDLYISFRKNGFWDAPRHLGANVNTAAAESSPSVSPDGRYFFFTSERSFITTLPKERPTYREMNSKLKLVLNGQGNIYQIGVSALGIKL